MAETTIGNPVNLTHLRYSLDNTRSHPDQFDGLLWDMGDGKIAVFFPDGRVRLAGSKGHDELIEQVTQLTRTLKSVNIPMEERLRLEITHCSASCDIGKSLDIESLMRVKPFRRGKRNLPNFPGLMARWDKDGGDLLIFPTGKVVVYGAGSESKARRTLEMAKKGIDEFGQ